MSNEHITTDCDLSPIKLVDGATFFCHSSYEARTLAIKERELIVGKIKNVFIFYSKDFSKSKQYKKNHQKLVSYFQNNCCTNVVEVEVSKLSLLSFMDERGDYLENCINESNETIVDISTFPRERMILLIDYLQRVSPDKKVKIIYCAPEKYASEKKESDSAWLSQGVRRIAPIPGFNGRQNIRKGCLLVIQLGHEGERALMTIKKIEPDKIILIGQSDEQYKEGIEKIFKKQSQSIIDEFGHKIEKIYLIAAHDYLASYNALWRVYELFMNKYNIVANLNGTKLQVLGAMRYCQENRNIELVHSDPQFYNYKAYSTGVGKCWAMEL